MNVPTRSQHAHCRSQLLPCFSCMIAPQHPAMHSCMSYLHCIRGQERTKGHRECRNTDGCITQFGPVCTTTLLDVQRPHPNEDEFVHGRLVHTAHQAQANQCCQHDTRIFGSQHMLGERCHITGWRVSVASCRHCAVPQKESRQRHKPSAASPAAPPQRP